MAHFNAPHILFATVVEMFRAARTDWSRLLRAGGMLFVASIAGGAIGYVYQILVGRLLPPADYGTLSAMMAIYAVLSVPVSAAGLYLARGFTGRLARDEIHELGREYGRAWRRCLLVVVAFGAIYAFMAEAVRSYFGLATIYAAVTFGLMVAVTALTPPNVAYLQGTQNFRWLAINGIVGQAGKALFGVLFIAWGFGVNGALAGVALSALVTVAMTSYVVLRTQRELARGRHIAMAPAAERETRGLMAIFVATLAFAMMSQLDVALVKGQYSPQEAGTYSAAAMLGKAIMYLPGALVVALFPMVAKNEALERSSLPLLLQALAIAFSISAAGAVFYLVTGDWLVHLLYGAAYQGAGEVLRVYGIAMIPMALITVLEHFLLAKGRAFFAYLMLSAAPLQWLLIARYHDRLTDAVWIVAGTGWGLLGAGVAWLAYEVLRAPLPRDPGAGPKGEGDR